MLEGAYRAEKDIKNLSFGVERETKDKMCQDKTLSKKNTSSVGFYFGSLH